MPRGVRKSELEKLKEELVNVQEAIQQYKEALTTMQEKEKNLQALICQEEFKTVKAMLDEREMSLDDLKNLLIQNDPSENLA